MSSWAPVVFSRKLPLCTVSSAAQGISWLLRSWRFITVFTKSCHRPLSWAIWIHSTSPFIVFMHP